MISVTGHVILRSRGQRSRSPGLSKLRHELRPNS